MTNGHKRHSKPSRHTRRAQATRNKLLNAARLLFAEKGFNLTSIDDITRRADVGKGTFYYHFSNWDEIIEALVTRMLDELLAVIEENCQGISDTKGILDALIGAHIKFFSNRWEDFVLFFQSRTELTLDQSYEGIETPFVEYLKRVEELLAPTIKRPLPQPILQRIACAVVGFVSGYYAFASIVSQEDDIDSTFRSLRGAMVESLARFVQEATPPQKK